MTATHNNRIKKTFLSVAEVAGYALLLALMLSTAFKLGQDKLSTNQKNVQASVGR
ncbi:MAG: hypothetical protein V4543_08810 [Bacteroidota bacterium]